MPELLSCLFCDSMQCRKIQGFIWNWWFFLQPHLERKIKQRKCRLEQSPHQVFGMRLHYSFSINFRVIFSFLQVFMPGPDMKTVSPSTMCPALVKLLEIDDPGNACSMFDCDTNFSPVRGGNLKPPCQEGDMPDLISAVRRCCLQRERNSDLCFQNWHAN
jgi:hypothetical protein